MTNPITKIESDVLQSTLRTLAEAGMTTDDTKWIRQNAETLIKYIREQRFSQSELHFKVEITSTETPTYAELCEAYDWVSDLWNEGKYTLELHETLREITPPTGEIEVFVKHFGRIIKSHEAIKWAKANGYRLAFPHEREAFTKANPDLQKRVAWIIDLASIALFFSGRQVPVLRLSGDGERYLNRNSFFHRWSANSHFLFVRE